MKMTGRRRPRRANTIFQLDGHSGDWLVYGGQLRLRTRTDGTVAIIGSTTTAENAGVMRFNDGSGRRALTMQTEIVRPSHNTPRIFQPLVGREFPTLTDARAAVIEAVQAPDRAKATANTARLTAAGFPADISGVARRAALKTLKEG